MVVWVRVREWNVRPVYVCRLAICWVDCVPRTDRRGILPDFAEKKVPTNFYPGNIFFRFAWDQNDDPDPVPNRCIIVVFVSAAVFLIFRIVKYNSSLINSLMAMIWKAVIYWPILRSNSSNYRYSLLFSWIKIYPCDPLTAFFFLGFNLTLFL